MMGEGEYCVGDRVFTIKADAVEYIDEQMKGISEAPADEDTPRGSSGIEENNRKNQPINRLRYDIELIMKLTGFGLAEPSTTGSRNELWFATST